MVLLQRKCLIHTIDGKYPDDTSGSEKEKIEGDALNVIYLSLAPTVLCEVSISIEEKVKELWKRLKGLYQDWSVTTRMLLQQRLHIFKMDSAMSLSLLIKCGNHLTLCDVLRHFEGDKGDEASGLFLKGRIAQQERRKSKYRSKSRVTKKNAEC
ncbi:hypothetical protein KY290_017514 [Solanum tuberosum]|uniref:Uncharacterized protein n=1 Tax=Solanum tuberosum TaxID=4113 RepID=A0ABQ7VBM1_SOLTU|nr:hypothetical protein KY290_017514 [Solanum tuberosum]